MELTLFVSGRGLRFTGDHIGEFEAGDLVLLGEKLPHYWDVRGDSSGISLQWDFSKGHAFWGFPETAELAGLFRKAGRGILLKRESARAVAGMMSEMLPTSGMERLGLLLRLLGFLARVPARDGEMLSNRSFSLAVGSMYQEVIGRTSFFNRTFRKWKGMSPGEWRRRARAATPA